MEVYDELEKALKELEKKDKVINDLLKKISDLEFEVEKQEQRIDKAIEYINNCSLQTTTNEYILSPNHLIDILKGVDKK